MRKPLSIYFLSIHSRCRTQMAEAFAKHFAGEQILVNSAGVEESEIHPLAIAVMKEDGIDISAYLPKRIDMKIFTSSNIVVKLCEKANERCPVVPFEILNIQWEIPDPTRKNGEQGSIEEFRAVRDEIKEKVLQLLQEQRVIGA
ncbi:arsenate reductase ArsC [Paenibacillus lignilyticus]|uniref:Arsenate reductase ArsC n=1 Tax=Paenibacillus lignilyticus TaxID=1172615 RepID=A0ABS5C9C2_9BACL|nr:arsenate reductase ArsC [Paenibacillus lignilyticus]MBP3962586.1 arsenate reductase ArsC [Paenibacillus lignilyticus]